MYTCLLNLLRLCQLVGWPLWFCTDKKYPVKFNVKNSMTTFHLLLDGIFGPVNLLFIAIHLIYIYNVNLPSCLNYKNQLFILECNHHNNTGGTKPHDDEFIGNGLFIKHDMFKTICLHWPPSGKTHDTKVMIN